MTRIIGWGLVALFLVAAGMIGDWTEARGGPVALATPPAAALAGAGAGRLEYDLVDQVAPAPALTFPQDRVPWLGWAGDKRPAWVEGATIKVGLPANGPACPPGLTCTPVTVQYRRTGQGDGALLLWPPGDPTWCLPAGQAIPWDSTLTILYLHRPATGCEARPAGQEAPTRLLAALERPAAPAGSFQPWMPIYSDPATYTALPGGPIVWEPAATIHWSEDGEGKYKIWYTGNGQTAWVWVDDGYTQRQFPMCSACPGIIYLPAAGLAGRPDHLRIGVQSTDPVSTAAIWDVEIKVGP